MQIKTYFKKFKESCFINSEKIKAMIIKAALSNIGSQNAIKYVLS